ncbi:MAG TPA: OB-fold domain-containing protein [Dermatophilaceae bacterium]|nr:OB-fold domain-containing protein [Dermatophilaceae bacterium]
MGRGSIHAMSVHHRPFGAMSLEDCPYIVAFIDLDEGVRFLANVVDTDDRSVTRGDAVVLTWKPVANGYNLPAFKPAPR